MPFFQSFRLLRHNLNILLIPITLDLIVLAVMIATTGWQLHSQWSYRIVLEMGLPSVFHLFNIPLTWVHVIVMLVWAFAQGGYIKALVSIIEGQPVRAAQVVKNGLKYWVPFAFLNITVLLAKAAASSLLIIMFGSIGAAASLLLFMVMRVLVVYWEFTVVVDNVNFDTAFRRSMKYFKHNSLSAIGMALIMFAASGAASVLANYFVMPAAVVVTMFIYSFIMSIIQLTLMLTLRETKR